MKRRYPTLVKNLDVAEPLLGLARGDARTSPPENVDQLYQSDRERTSRGVGQCQPTEESRTEFLQWRT